MFFAAVLLKPAAVTPQSLIGRNENIYTPLVLA